MRMPKSQPWSPGLKNVKPKKNLHHNRYIADLSNKICSNIPVFSSSDSSTISVSPDSSSMESERLSLEGLAELLFSAVLVRSELGVLRFQRSLIGLQFQKSGHCSDCLNLLTSTARLSLLDFILLGAIYHKTVNKSTQMCTQSNWESNTDFLCTLVFTNIFLFPCIKCWPKRVKTLAQRNVKIVLFGASL